VIRRFFDILLIFRVDISINVFVLIQMVVRNKLVKMNARDLEFHFPRHRVQGTILNSNKLMNRHLIIM